MGNYDGAIVTVTNWERFTTRKDIKASSWFRLSNTFLEDPDFYGFTDGELLTVIYMFSQCSKRMVDNFRLVYAHAKRIGGRSEKDITGAVDKLLKHQIISIDVTCTSRARHVDVTLQTDKQTNKQTNIINQTNENAGAPPIDSFVEIWNDNCGTLPKITKATDKRAKAIKARLSETPSLDYWRDIVVRIAASKFCQGENDRGWKATFDFLVKPDTHIKTLEGQYDERKPFAPKTNATVPSRPEHVVFRATLRTDDEASAQGKFNVSELLKSVKQIELPESIPRNQRHAKGGAAS
ncbi:MAG: hypothetical protein V4568_14570 [Pseudomonadota bacterium]